VRYEPAVTSRRLSHLKLAGCAALLDAALERACVRSPRLRKLDVSRCTALEAPSLACPALEALSRAPV